MKPYLITREYLGLDELKTLELDTPSLNPDCSDSLNHLQP